MAFGTSNPGPSANHDPVAFAYQHPQVPLEVKEYLVAPEPLQLEQVHVYVRHGERTPVGVRLTGPPANIPEHWAMCRRARRFRSALSGILEKPGAANHDEIVHARKIVERKDGNTVDGECLLGELTDLGRHTTFSFGKNLRRLYVERLGFLPDQLDTDDVVYFRTTNMPRTTESLQEIVHGLYPPNKCHPSSIPAVRVRNGKDENLVGNTYSCKRLAHLLVGFAEAAAEKYNPSLSELDEKLSKFINGNPVRVDGKPRASGILDTVRSSIAHGIDVPDELKDKNTTDLIEQAITAEWFGDKTTEVRRLGIGPLFKDMLNKLDRKVDQGDKNPLKILVHATHDTAIAAIHQTLDVFDEKWPAFTASVIFELYKGPSPQGVLEHSQVMLARLRGNAPPTHYIRMRSQNKSIKLPLCAGEGQHLPGHPEFCTLQAFKDGMEAVIPLDWDKECSVSST
ncbi:phosphoglycerate mutase-like protein [Coprinellus micaceus]|uniref:Phosphoglycerate mutase-like protein n=1 Tax=Coprinellus micaceus TaxID=71717 RepID=A0A4Y7TE83_COPMI|nr:phosphoglycerate mutase-like protein [Coprinellus micaceus]